MSFRPPGLHAGAYGSSTVFAFVHTPLLLKFPALCVSHTKKPHPLLCSVASAVSSRDKTVSVRREAEAASAWAPRRESCRSQCCTSGLRGREHRWEMGDVCMISCHPGGGPQESTWAVPNKH